MSLVGPNGKPIGTITNGDTGRTLRITEIMVKGEPFIKTEAKGTWFKDNTAGEHLRGRLMMAKYFQDASNAILRDLLGTFVDKEVNEEVQSTINQMAQGEDHGIPEKQ